LVAAAFSPSQDANMFYGGNYEGVVAGGSWMLDRYSASASWAYYRLLRNGAEHYGVGDLVVNGQIALLARPELRAGVMLGISTPTGSELDGFGMGHAMAMPAGFVSSRQGRIALSGSFGYGRGLASGAHVHGMAPLVEPMNMSELTWSAGGDVVVGGGALVGVLASGGVPIAMPGTNRVVGALHVAWGAGRIGTIAEVQVGLAGDPFNTRGVVSTALRF
jgi:hypothetical protein